MFNPFDTVSSYAEMLKKIAFFTWAGAVLVTVFLRRTVPEIDEFLASGSIDVSMLGFSIPLLTLAPAFAVALIARMFKLHDRVSDLLGIRARFDVTEILFPLALNSRSTVNADAIRRNRIALMRATFYQFASSSAGTQSIPAHYVAMALDQWGWYWVLVENAVTLLVAAAICITFKHFGASAILLATVLLFLWALQGIRVLCVKSALEEVDQILLDESRKQVIARTFNAIQG